MDEQTITVNDADVTAAALPTLPADDAGLLRRAQQGDYLAFADLTDRYAPQLLRFVRRLVGDGEAEDLVQDVFVTLFTHLHQIDPPEKLRPWLFRCARNRAYDELRSRGRMEAVTLDDEPVEQSASLAQHDAAPQPEDVAHWLLLYLQVQTVMDRLPEAQRQALILFAEEGMSYPEIAEIMGCSLGTVKSRIFYAKRTLRRLLPPDTLQALDVALSDENDEE
jgi:RNA polymerase sigma-70 factor (ECF subfamily)